MELIKWWRKKNRNKKLPVVFRYIDTLSLRKNKTLKSDKNKNILLAEIKEHAI